MENGHRSPFCRALHIPLGGSGCCWPLTQDRVGLASPHDWGMPSCPAKVDAQHRLPSSTWVHCSTWSKFPVTWGHNGSPSIARIWPRPRDVPVTPKLWCTVWEYRAEICGWHTRWGGVLTYRALTGARCGASWAGKGVGYAFLCRTSQERGWPNSLPQTLTEKDPQRRIPKGRNVGMATAIRRGSPKAQEWTWWGSCPFHPHRKATQWEQGSTTELHSWVSA